MSKQRLSIGDVVRHKKRSWGRGVDIICEVVRRGGITEYATTRQGAWFTRKNFVFLREGGSKELKEVDRGGEEEDE